MELIIDKGHLKFNKYLRNNNTKFKIDTNNLIDMNITHNDEYCIYFEIQLIDVIKFIQFVTKNKLYAYSKILIMIIYLW